MQIQQSMNVEVSLKVTYRGEDDCRISVVAIAPYANGTRSATATMAVQYPPEDLIDACGDILEAYGRAAAEQAIADASEAQRVAQRRGEV